MTTRIRKFSRYVVETDEGSFDIAGEPLTDSLMVEVVGNRAVLVYAAQDEDARNPLEENDSMGSIYSSSRHAGREEHRKFQDALGLDENWEPDLSSIDEELREELEGNDFQAIEWVKSYEGGYSELVYLKSKMDKPDEYYWNAAKEFDDSLGEIIHKESIKRHKEGRGNGTIGAKYYLSLDVYEHSGTWYSLRDEGMQCEWDTARGGALWVANEAMEKEFDELPEDTRWQTIRKLVRGIAETYTNYCNGNVYGIILHTYTRENEEGEWEEDGPGDSCWGYYGWEDTKQEMKEWLEGKADNWKKEETPCTSES